MILTSNLIAQDEVKNKIAKLWWDNEIEIMNNRNQKLDYDDAIYVIRNQKVTTNCWSNFYRYTQNIQESSGEQALYYPLTNCNIIQESANEFKVVSLIDNDTGEEKHTDKFTYKRINQKINITQRNNELIEFLNKELKISKVIFKDSLEQLLDKCHEKYSIQLGHDGTFKQGFDNEVNCTCEINSEEFKQIHHIGFAKFDEASHSLLGLNGNWKLENGNLYLKFLSGNIFKYEYEIAGSRIELKNSLTTILLKKPTDNNR